MRAGIRVLVAMCWVAAHVPAQDGGSAAGSKVLALESAWNMAEEKGDVRALNLILDNSMIYIDEDGALMNKTQFLARVKQDRAKLQSLVTQNIGVRVYAGTAVVAGTYRAKGVQRGKAYLRDGRFIDTWVLKGGRWVCVVAQSTPVLR
jgi:uncharacterized protein DUF4440